jgi:hypothetical protein
VKMEHSLKVRQFLKSLITQWTYRAVVVEPQLEENGNR